MMIIDQYHALLHEIIHLLGHETSEASPEWLHSILHVILVFAPALLVVVCAYHAVGWFYRCLLRRSRARRSAASRQEQPTVFRYIIQHTRNQQIFLMGLGLLSLPVLYATLEFPKTIINSAIDAPEHVTVILGRTLSQTEHLLVLCALYLTVIMLNGSIKLVLNIYKGKVGERLLRRLRLAIFRRWRSGAGSHNRAEVIPLVVQEVEPIGGFASDALALPVFQGGTFLTILAFMFIQDPYLGAAALTLLPVQIVLIPRFQLRINALARRRVAEVRTLGGQLGEQAGRSSKHPDDVRTVGASLRNIEVIRLKIHRTKFLMKALNNFLTALTPFFFFSIGGYLVIDGQLSLGALVAVLAAFKDFSAPLRELFRYYQSLEDVRIRFDEINKFLAEGSSQDQQPSI